jgi:hypothetical protein
MIGKQALAVLLGRVRKKKIRVCSPAIFKRVVNTRAGRFRRIDPPGEGQKPLRNRQPIIVDDILDIRLGSQHGDCVIDVNDCLHTVGLNT